jgi:hypothetical protein
LPPRNDSDESDSDQDRYSRPVHPQQVPED